MNNQTKRKELEHFVNHSDGAVFNGIDDFCNEMTDYHEKSRLSTLNYTAQEAVDELRELLKEMLVEAGKEVQ